MAARAIVGIALGIIFAPILWILMVSPSDVVPWLLNITTNFTGFIGQYATWGTGTVGLGDVSGGAMTCNIMNLFTIMGIGLWLETYAAALITWAVIGIWAGSIERSAGRGIGVGIGIWLGWLIIELIYMIVANMIPLFMVAIVAQFFTAVVVIIFAAIFGAITKSEEF